MVVVFGFGTVRIGLENTWLAVLVRHHNWPTGSSFPTAKAPATTHHEGRRCKAKINLHNFCPSSALFVSNIIVATAPALENSKSLFIIAFHKRPCRNNLKNQKQASGSEQWNGKQNLSPEINRPNFQHC